MTLCLAWRNSNGAIHLVSDSRITLNGKFSDFGLKVFSVPVRVYLPTSKGSSNAEIAFENTYGLAFAGSFLGVQLLREHLFIVLQNLQCIPNYLDYSFEAVCKIVEQYFSYLLKTIHADLNDEITIDFFFTGYCQKSDCCRIAKFFVTYNEDITSFQTHSEILPNTEIIDTIGGGNKSFLTPLKGKPLPEKELLKLFSTAILDSCGPSVGGNIQYGSFDKKNNFRVRGVIKHNELQASAGFFYGGIDMNGAVFGHNGDNLFFMGSYVDPFSD